MKFIYFILILVLGFLLIKYAKWLKDATGVRFGFAEQFFGYGGTTTAIKIIGFLAILFAFYYTFNMN